MAKKEDNLHSGHRQRLRLRYIKNGMDGMDEHQALELLLFYAIPRRDTNELAHLLLNQFGSLRGIFEANIERLREVEGVGESAAALIKLVPDIASKYWFSANKGSYTITSIASAAEYFKAMLFGKPVEHFYIACVDSAFRVKNCTLLSSGTPSQTPVEMNRIARIATGMNAEKIIIAHNHPGGSVSPSQSDIRVTMAIFEAMAGINITLIDHIIISDEDFFSFTAHQLIGRDYTKEQAHAAKYSSGLMDGLPDGLK